MGKRGNTSDRIQRSSETGAFSAFRLPPSAFRLSVTDLLPAETASAAETVRLGESVGRELEPGDVVALTGDLGAGKTHLAKGIAAALGVDPATVTSPTFALVQEHADGALLHLDLYRIESAAEADRLGLGEMLDGDAIALVEWPERAADWLPTRTIWLRLSHLGADRRRVERIEPPPTAVP